MPKFSKDKQSLLKTLSKLDNGVTVSEVIDLEPKESENSTLVFHVILEAICGLTERDEEKRRRLFNGVVAFLTKSKLLDEQIALQNLLHIRRKMAVKFLKLVNKVHRTISPNPVCDIQYFDFIQSDSSYQKKYSDMFEEIKVIAEGGFGTVCMARHKIDELVYAVKKIIFKYRKDSDYLRVIREVRSISTLNHLNVVSYNSAWIEEAEEQTSDSSSNSDVSSEWEDSSICFASSRSSNKWSDSKESNHSLYKNDLRSKFFQSSGSSDVSQRTSRESNDSIVTQVGDISMDNFMCPKVMLCIQMEYCDCDLRHWLDKRTKGESFPCEMNETSVFRDILMGVAHIHSKSIIHRDLKPQNIFFSAKEGVMKIGDFGLATLGGSIPNKQQRGNISTRLSSDLGTLPYAAPEQRNKHHYTTKVDIYSLGIILIELLLHFSTHMEFCRTIENVARGNIPSEMVARWPNYVFLVENLIQKDPNNRLSAKEILSLPVIQGNENTKNCEGRELLIERLSQKLVEQRSRIEEQALTIAQLRRQIEELTCS